MEGLVTKNTGSWYIVRTENGDSIRCKIKGNFRLKGIRSTNPVSVGDLVDIELNPDQTAFITRIHERKNYIIRRSSNLSKESHIIAANIDYALLIVTVNTPPTSTTFIDRFLATAEAYRIPVCIVINKSDTFTEEDREYAEALRYLYTSIGYDCHCVSAITGEGFDFIDSFIANKITLLSGHSGVGKSTIIDRILPNAHVKSEPYPLLTTKACTRPLFRDVPFATRWIHYRHSGYKGLRNYRFQSQRSGTFLSRNF